VRQGVIRRGFALRAVGVIAAALAGVVAPFPAAATAFAAPTLTVELSPGSFDMKGGDTRSMTVKLTNAGPPARVSMTVSAPTGLNGDVSLANSDSSCSGSGSTVVCTVAVGADAQKNVVFTLTAKNPDSLGAGQSRTDTSGAITAAVGPGTTTLSYAVTLHGLPQTSAPSQSQGQSAGVAEVSGTVVDSGTAQPVPGATVVLQGAGQTLQTTSDSSGGFVFASSSSQRIAAGTLSLAVSRDLYQPSTTKTIQARSGQSYTGIRIAMTLLTNASSGGSADPSESDSVTAYGAGPVRRASGSHGWLLTASGVLLVLSGAAIATVVAVRRRQARRAARQEAWPPPDDPVIVPGVDPWAGR